MDSLFRTRGSGISSDIESTIVPQLLAEIDGVELLKNVIVIGASNREDLIDPAILRPGRLDVKIKIERPDAESAKAIFHAVPHDRRCRSPTASSRRAGGDAETAIGRMIDAAVDAHVRDRRREQVPRGHVPERRQGAPVLQGLLVGRHDREHRAPREEAVDQARDRRAATAASAPTICSSRSSRSSASTRTCRTRPTPTTGRRSPARRASASSTCARS